MGKKRVKTALWKAFTVRLPPEWYSWLKGTKISNGVPVQEVVISALEAYKSHKWPAGSLGVDITADERRALLVALDLLRTAPRADRKLFSEMLEWWQHRRE